MVRWHEAVRGTSDATAGFAPLGEALTWAATIAELVGAEREPVYAGISHARNIVLHGYVVVRLYGSRATGAYGTATYGTVPYGGGFTREFLPRADLPSPRRNPTNEAGYDSDVARREVASVLALAANGLRQRPTAKRGD